VEPNGVEEKFQQHKRREIYVANIKKVVKLQSTDYVTHVD